MVVLISGKAVRISLAGRVAKQLLVLAYRFGADDGGALRVTPHLTQEEIAQLAGASPDAASKALHDFEDRGWIRLGTNAVAILNPDQLASRAGSHAGPIS